MRPLGREESRHELFSIIIAFPIHLCLRFPFCSLLLPSHAFLLLRFLSVVLSLVALSLASLGLSFLYNNDKTKTATSIQYHIIT